MQIMTEPVGLTDLSLKRIIVGTMVGTASMQLISHNFKCQECGREFLLESRYMNHMRVHDVAAKTFLCDICGKGFITAVRLRKHGLVHSEARTVSCSLCVKRFKEGGALSRHIRSRHTRERPYKCYICGDQFTVAGILKVHMRIHTGERPYICGTCGDRFTISGALKVHMRTHTGERPYICPQCPKRFINNGHLQTHMSSHTSERPFVCKLCSKAFCSLENLTVHHRMHSGERPYMCEFCGKVFRSYGDMKKHTRVHNGDKPYACRTCGKAFKQASGLQLHVKLHDMEQLYECKDCGDRFSQPNMLQAHSLTHIDEPLSEIPSSKEPFVESEQRRESIIAHSDMTSHSCNICNWQLTQRGILFPHRCLHARSHSHPHRCGICGMSFTSVSQLGAHSVTHCSMNNQQCNICSQSFTQPAELNRHMTIHMGTTYSCTICGKTFLQQSDLKYHISTHSQEDITASAESLSQVNHIAPDEQNISALINNNISKLTCHQCNECFESITALAEHVHLHEDHSESTKTGVKPSRQREETALMTLNEDTPYLLSDGLPKAQQFEASYHEDIVPTTEGTFSGFQFNSSSSRSSKKHSAFVNLDDLLGNTTYPQTSLASVMRKSFRDKMDGREIREGVIMSSDAHPDDTIMGNPYKDHAEQDVINLTVTPHHPDSPKIEMDLQTESLDRNEPSDFSVSTQDDLSNCSSARSQAGSAVGIDVGASSSTDDALDSASAMMITAYKQKALAIIAERNNISNSQSHQLAPMQPLGKISHLSPHGIDSMPAMVVDGILNDVQSAGRPQQGPSPERTPSVEASIGTPCLPASSTSCSTPPAEEDRGRENEAVGEGDPFMATIDRETFEMCKREYLKFANTGSAVESDGIIEQPLDLTRKRIIQPMDIMC